MKTREQAAEEFIDNTYGRIVEDRGMCEECFLAGCEFEAQNSANLAKAFSKWVELSSWHLDFKEQRTHTIDEKFEYFLVVVWPFSSLTP